MVKAFEQPLDRHVKRGLGVGTVAVAQVTLLLITYRARVLTHAALWSSDILVFAMPSLLGLIGYLLFLNSRRTSWVLALGISIGLTFLTLSLAVVIAFNIYGT